MQLIGTRACQVKNLNNTRARARARTAYRNNPVLICSYRSTRAAQDVPLCTLTSERSLRPKARAPTISYDYDYDANERALHYIIVARAKFCGRARASLSPVACAARRLLRVATVEFKLAS